MRRASSWSLFFGILALLCLPLTLPSGQGHRINPLYPFAVLTAALGFVCGLAGLMSRGKRGRAVGGILLCGLCAIAWARWQQNEWYRTDSAAFGDIRTVISAQVAYGSANAGLYGPLECLGQPSACIPGYPEMAPTFLDSTLASSQPHNGYKRGFFAGPPGKGLSASSMTSFAYVAVPITPGKTGGRGLCGDSLETFCATADGSMPLVRDGRCVVAVERRWFQRASDCIPLK